jgi:hypothetical protein
VPVSQPEATQRPFSVPVSPPADPMTLALIGQMARGGYWTWQDISNLTGVYGTPGEFQTATVNGVRYSGVPLAYLLRYVRLNDDADKLIVLSRGGSPHHFALSSPDDFMDYLIAPTSQNALALVLPEGQELRVIENLTYLEVQRVEASDPLNNAPIPGDPQAVYLAGNVSRSGTWTWEQISNLLGIYAAPERYQTVELQGRQYSGVPIAYLLDYADPTGRRPHGIMFYNRSGESTVYFYNALENCLDCIITPAESGALTLLVPGNSTQEVWPELASIVFP